MTSDSMTKWLPHSFTTPSSLHSLSRELPYEPKKHTKVINNSPTIYSKVRIIYDENKELEELVKETTVISQAYKLFRR